MSVSIIDHKNEDGTTDWQSYQVARMDLGEICGRCQKLLPIPWTGTTTHCDECARADYCSGPTAHTFMVRCPECQAKFKPAEPLPRENGPLEIQCTDCNNNFAVMVLVHRTFLSPEIFNNG